MNRQIPVQISVIVTTYNWPSALRMVLTALVAQKTSCPYEIIIADDGSGDATAAFIRDFKKTTPIPIQHVWQPDDGFRAAAIRNKAILAAKGDYIIFLDGDCVPRETFIQGHFELAELKTLVAGNRILLTQEFTKTVLEQGCPLHLWSFWRWCWVWFSGQCNRIQPLILVPARWPRLKSSCHWKGAKGCNLGVWKADLFVVNGWEEKFVGWGSEDSDLVIRLLKSGIKRKTARFCVPVFHLWHPENDRVREHENRRLLLKRQQDAHLYAEKGLK